MSAPGTVLFDIGGVLASDYWETLLLTPEDGLADRLEAPRDAVIAAAQALWPEFATREAAETEYWSRLSQALNISIDAGVVAITERALIRANGQARERIGDLRRQGIRVGVVSNNTSFWWPRQLELAAVDDLVEAALTFVSCRFGVTKADHPAGLFDVVAAHVEPATTLIIDDREHNVEAALGRGFQAVRYCFEHDPWPAQLSAIAA